MESGAYSLEVEFDFFFIRRYVYPEPQHDEWGPEKPFMDGWSYRKAHVIKGSEGAGTDYPISITVHRYPGNSSYPDSGDDVYVGYNVNEDFSDIRFLDETSHITQRPNFLEQWIERIWTENSGEADEHLCVAIWVSIEENLDTDQMIYLYYGNELATTANNGSDIFLFYDQFNKWDGTKWTKVRGNYSMGTGTITLWDNVDGIQIKAEFSGTDYSFETMFKATNVSTGR
jgi:hypothetical protein